MGTTVHSAVAAWLIWFSLELVREQSNFLLYLKCFFFRPCQWRFLRKCWRRLVRAELLLLQWFKLYTEVYSASAVVCDRVWFVVVTVGLSTMAVQYVQVWEQHVLDQIKGIPTLCWLLKHCTPASNWQHLEMQMDTDPSQVPLLTSRVIWTWLSGQNIPQK